MSDQTCQKSCQASSEAKVKPRSSKSSRFMHLSSKRPLLLAGPWAETQNPKLEITNSEHSRYLKIWVPYLCRLRKMDAKLLPSDRGFVWHHAACSLALCGILRKVTRDIHPSVRRHKRKAVQGAKTYSSNERHIPEIHLPCVKRSKLPMFYLSVATRLQFQRRFVRAKARWFRISR